jgi:DNA-binding transcriptional ArsR family regulator
MYEQNSEKLNEIAVALVYKILKSELSALETLAKKRLEILEALQEHNRYTRDLCKKLSTVGKELGDISIIEEASVQGTKLGSLADLAGSYWPQDELTRRIEEISNLLGRMENLGVSQYFANATDTGEDAILDATKDHRGVSFIKSQPSLEETRRAMSERPKDPMAQFKEAIVSGMQRAIAAGPMDEIEDEEVVYEDKNYKPSSFGDPAYKPVENDDYIEFAGIKIKRSPSGGFKH